MLSRVFQARMGETFQYSEEKNINLRKIIFQRYGNMHVSIIYYINRFLFRLTPYSGWEARKVPA